MKYIIYLLAIISLVACGNLEKEIVIELPTYDDQPVVECYLQPGAPYKLLLTHSSSYFAPFEIENNNFLASLLIDSATVFIVHGADTIPLPNVLNFDFTNFKAYNYTSTAIVPADYEGEFKLFITLKDGKTINGTTRILPIVPIDSVVVEIKDSLASTITYCTDPITPNDFYRRTVHVNTLDSLRQDFMGTDKFIAPGSQGIAFGTGFDPVLGDTMIFTIYHADQAYYDFFRSVQGSLNANPGAQPGAIISNVFGTANPIGIFTGLSFDRDSVIIQQ